MICGKVLADAGHQEPGTVLPQEETVPRERVSMRKLLELLRLHFDLKLSQRQIAGSIKLGKWQSLAPWISRRWHRLVLESAP
jgi:hypothetical protein